MQSVVEFNLVARDFLRAQFQRKGLRMIVFCAKKEVDKDNNPEKFPELRINIF